VRAFPPWGTVGPLGVRVVCMRDIHLFSTKYGRKTKYIFFRHFAWLKYFTCHLLLVLVLAPNYKQHFCHWLKLEKYIIH
jgi:NADH:ubiquinone oxidoreductase subunit 5 (subunit L)/multisubunit Na+/H+ antiporter MnhA subunit